MICWRRRKRRRITTSQTVVDTILSTFSHWRPIGPKGASEEYLDYCWRDLLTIHYNRFPYFLIQTLLSCRITPNWMQSRIINLFPSASLPDEQSYFKHSITHLNSHIKTTNKQRISEQDYVVGYHEIRNRWATFIIHTKYLRSSSYLFLKY